MTAAGRNRRMVAVPVLSWEPGAARIAVHSLGPDAMAVLRRHVQGGGLLQAIFSVNVAGHQGPGVSGSYRLSNDGICFEPHFPFETDLPYEARFDPRPLADPDLTEVLTLRFARVGDASASAPQVEDIFPSAEILPTNLLRLYVRFSGPMRRGHAGAEIELLGPDDEPAPDVLYRAPVELWDRSMRHLTVLLDPGRLKRGVGPNRELGPPLVGGQIYTLVIGAGMIGLAGARLGTPIRKRFRVTDAVRTRVDPSQWQVIAPAMDTRQPLALTFHSPLDRALLSSAITVMAPDGRPLDGHVAIDLGETRWRFTPALPWGAGPHRITVDPGLEDVCGNSVAAAFDRPLRSTGHRPEATTAAPIVFDPMRWSTTRP